MAAVKLTASIVEKFIPPRAQNSRKGDNGKILILGGSYVYHGAPILASLAALRCGTDLVYTAVPKINSQATRAASPNLIVIPLADQKLTRGAAKKLLGQTPVGLDSAAIGMGLAVQERNSLLLLIKTLLDSDVRVLLDASALVPEVLPEISGKNCILSPHAGEYKRLFGHAVPDDDASREREVEKMAAEHKVVIILKGATDIISDGETTYTNPKKTPSMTVGGTGDMYSCDASSNTRTSESTSIFMQRQPEELRCFTACPMSNMQAESRFYSSLYQASFFAAPRVNF